MVLVQNHFLNQCCAMKKDVSKKNSFVKDFRILGIGQWENWSECSKTCGSGIKTRQRTCQDGTCSETLSESALCNEKGCGYKKNYSVKDIRILGIEQWENWSECSKTCGNGIRTRRRTCQDGFCSEILLDTSACFRIGCEYISTNTRIIRK